MQGARPSMEAKNTSDIDLLLHVHTFILLPVCSQLFITTLKLIFLVCYVPSRLPTVVNNMSQHPETEKSQFSGTCIGIAPYRSAVKYPPWFLSGVSVWLRCCSVTTWWISTICLNVCTCVVARVNQAGGLIGSRKTSRRLLECDAQYEHFVFRMIISP